MNVSIAQQNGKMDISVKVGCSYYLLMGIDFFDVTNSNEGEDLLLMLLRKSEGNLLILVGRSVIRYNTIPISN